MSFIQALSRYWRPRPVDTPSATSEKEKKVADKDNERRGVEGLQVAVLVAMPTEREKRYSSSSGEEGFPAVALGISRIPWDKDVSAEVGNSPLP